MEVFSYKLRYFFSLNVLKFPNAQIILDLITKQTTNDLSFQNLYPKRNIEDFHEFRLLSRIYNKKKLATC